MAPRATTNQWFVMISDHVHPFLLVPACTPAVHFTFDYGIHDQSGRRQRPQLLNVLQTAYGSAHFNGKSALRVPGLANSALADKLVLKIRYGPRDAFPSGSDLSIPLCSFPSIRASI